MNVPKAVVVALSWFVKTISNKYFYLIWFLFQNKTEQDKLDRWKNKRLYAETFRMSYFRKELESNEKTTNVSYTSFECTISHQLFLSAVIDIESNGNYHW